MFVVTLELGSLRLIQELYIFFGCGNIIVTKNSATFRVTNFFHIWHIIIPHFLKYPFVGRKFLVFKIFVIVCSLILPFYHKTLPYSSLFKIIYLSFLMNEGTKRSLKDLQSLLLSINAKLTCSTDPSLQSRSNLKLRMADQSVVVEKFNDELIFKLTNKALDIQDFPTEFKILPNNFSLINSNYNIELTYILGIIEGDGSFFIRFLSTPNIYSFGFSITTSIDDLTVLILIKNKLGCGTIRLEETWCRLDINSIDQLNNIIIPLVDSLQNYRGNNLKYSPGPPYGGGGNNFTLLSHKAKYYSI